MAYARTNENEADLLTKPLLNGENRKNIVRRVLHHIFRSEERRNVEKQALFDNAKLQFFSFVR